MFESYGLTNIKIQTYTNIESPIVLVATEIIVIISVANHRS